jgi:hypothetical protein
MKLKLHGLSIMLALLAPATSSVLGAQWTVVTTNAGWSQRVTFGAVTFNNQMWVLGGETATSLANDVWSSTNGADWTFVTNAAWSPRATFGAVTLNGQMWVLGGQTSTTYNNDVWSSTNGADWTLVTNNAPWNGREIFGAVALNGRMWVLGGYNSTSGAGTNDVWSSTNGLAWTRVTNAAAWGPRDSFATATFSNQLWVLGGTIYSATPFNTNFVYSSSNGAAWTAVTNAAPWSPRVFADAVTFNNQMWLLGGFPLATGYANDVWVYGANANTLLTITHSGNVAIISWPASATGWTLQTNLSLSPGTWGNYTGNTSNNSATNSTTTGNLFFRLTQP